MHEKLNLRDRPRRPLDSPGFRGGKPPELSLSADGGTVIEREVGRIFLAEVR
jgi:hypothetical protein